MRDGRLLLMLVVALGVIVVGGVTVPILLSVLPPLTERMASPNASAAEPSKPPAEIPPAVVAAAERLSEAFRGAAERVKPAVVAIGTSQTVNVPATPFGGAPDDFLRRFFGMGPDDEEGGGGAPPRKFQRQGLGSGVIVDSDGYVLTNNHVIAGADEIIVHLADGREFKAKVIGADPPTDVAVIKVQAENLPVAALGDSGLCQPGDWVVAIGAPFGLELTVTAGIISATGRHNVGISTYESFLQTDAAINPGNSGGPLINMRGEVVGINSAIASRTGGYMGIGFAVPINMAKDVMKQIRATGHVTRGWLGVAIQRITPDIAKTMNLKTQEGALVSQVLEDGPAAKAGLKTGDVVVEYAGKAVKGPSELQEAVAFTAPDTKVDVVVLREGKRETLKVTVQKRSEQEVEETAGQPPGPTELKELGIEVSNLTAERAQRLGYKLGQGVLITGVDPAGLGAMGGLKPGMLLLQAANRKVTSVAELKDALAKADLAVGIPLLVRAGNVQTYIVLKKRG